MSTPRRKSSLGTSRRVPAKYIPYHADDYQRGKRTGLVVGYIEHNSDEFEPFEQVMNQADQRTPPRVQGVRKKRITKTPVVQQPEETTDDENGEMSMELEESLRNSPASYFTNARSARITSSAQRVGSSSRPVRRSSDVDFDQVPSPRSPSTFVRSPLARTRSPGPSRLSHSIVAPDQDEDQLDQDIVDDSDLGGLDFHNDGFDDDDDDDDGVPDPISQSSATHSRKQDNVRRRTTFTAIDEDDEDEIAQVDEGVDPRISPEFSAKRTLYPIQEQINQDGDNELLEDDIAQDMQEPNGQVEEGDHDVTSPRKRGRGRPKIKRDTAELEEPSSKRARTDAEAPEPKRRRGRPRKENVVQVLSDVTQDRNDPQGLRRGTRTRYAPLEWWRLEKVVYGRRGSGTCLVPTIKEILRVPKEDPQPLGAKRKRRARSQSKAKSVEPTLVFNPEEGWDDETDPSGVVIDYEEGTETTRRLACTAKMITPKPAANNEFYFQKVFGDGDFIAAGQLIIPPKKQKPTKGTKDNTFVFYVIEGAVNCKIHETSFIISTGGMFLVPRGNLYFIQNISDRDAKLFFAQARKIVLDDDGDDTSRRSVSIKLQRQQSGGPAPRSSTARASSEVHKALAYHDPPLRKAGSVRA